RVDELAQAPGDEPEQRLELDLRGERVADLVERLELLEPPRRRLVQPRVLDRDGRLRCEELRELEILLGELATILLLREIEVPVGDAALRDRHAEERRHRRVVRWEADRARVFGDVPQAQRLRLADEHAEDPAAARQVADRVECLGSDPRGEEALEPLAGLVDDAARREARSRELGRRLDEALEQSVERELRGERDPRLDEDAEAIAVGRRGHVRILTPSSAPLGSPCGERCPGVSVAAMEYVNLGATGL